MALADVASAAADGAYAFVTIVDGNYKYVARALRMVQSIRWNLHEKRSAHSAGAGDSDAAALARRLRRAARDVAGADSSTSSTWAGDGAASSSTSHTTSQLVATSGPPIFIVNTGIKLNNIFFFLKINNNK